MGCPIGTVMSRLHRGRKLLQRTLYNHALALGIVKGEEQPGRRRTAEPQARREDREPRRVPRAEAGCGMTMHECRDRARLLGVVPRRRARGGEAHRDRRARRAGARRAAKRRSCLRAMRGSLKRVVRTPAPGGLRDRIGDRDGGRARREDARADAESEPLGAKAPLVSLASWRTMVPLATAAALALFWGAATRGTQAASTEAARRLRRRSARGARGRALVAACRPRRRTPTPSAASSATSACRCARELRARRRAPRRRRASCRSCVAARGDAPVRRRHGRDRRSA